AAGGILYSPLIGFVIAIPMMFLGKKVKSSLLRRLREKLILPDPIIAFDCVRCGRRHGALAHSSHPPKKCKTCKIPWKNEWADYWKRPIVEMHMDDVKPGRDLVKDASGARFRE